MVGVALVKPQTANNRMLRERVGADGICESLTMRRLLTVDPGDQAVLTDLDDGTASGWATTPPTWSRAERTRTRTAVWSPAGQWAASAVDSPQGDGDGAQEVRVFPAGGFPGGVPGGVASALTAFYLNPSPCGRYLSHLSPGPLGLELAVSDVTSGKLRRRAGPAAVLGMVPRHVRGSPCTSPTGSWSRPPTAGRRTC